MSISDLFRGPRPEPVQTTAAQQTRTIARGTVLLMAQLSEASKAQRPSALVTCPECSRKSFPRVVTCPNCHSNLAHVPVDGCVFVGGRAA